MDNFMIVSVPEFREWLKEDAGIDWSRVTEETSIQFSLEENFNSTDEVQVTVFYNDEEDNNIQEIDYAPYKYLGLFEMEINLKKLMDIVDKATLEMFMFDGENDIVCEYTPKNEQKL